MKYLLTLVFTLYTIALSAQLETGSITYSMEMGEMEGEMAQVASMMQDMSMTVSFKPGMSVTEMDMMGFIKTKTIQEGTKMTQYMDMMGQKIKTVTDTDNMQEILGAEGEELMEKIGDMYSLTKVPGDTKEILGYTCTRTNVNMNLEAIMPEGEDAADIPDDVKNMQIIMYTTEDIKMDNLNFQMVKDLKFDGAPLMMIIDAGPMKMTMSATTIGKEVDPSVWLAPKGDYQEMDLNDLQNMGLDGFGF